MKVPPTHNIQRRPRHHIHSIIEPFLLPARVAGLGRADLEPAGVEGLCCGADELGGDDEDCFLDSLINFGFGNVWDCVGEIWEEGGGYLVVAVGIVWVCVVGEPAPEDVGDFSAGISFCHRIMIEIGIVLQLTMCLGGQWHGLEPLRRRVSLYLD